MSTAEHDRRAILRSLVTISRRGVADARRSETPLSMTDQSIVGFIADNRGVRGVDVAAEFRLNRSTVSRQINGLIRLGIVRESTEATGRGRPLELTDAGEAAYRETFGILQEIIDDQLADWTATEVERFAVDLARFTDHRPTRAAEKEES